MAQLRASLLPGDGFQEENNQVQATPKPELSSSYGSIAFQVALVFALSAAWTLSVNLHKEWVPGFLEKLFIISWVYKFLPQIRFSASRKLTSGLSITSALLGFSGYLILAIFSGFLGNDSIEDRRAEVQFGVAVLSVVGSGIVFFQMYCYRRVEKDQNRLAPFTGVLLSATVLIDIAYGILVLLQQQDRYLPINRKGLISLLSYEAAIYLSVRLLPQVVYNHSKKRFHGQSSASIVIECLGSVAALALIGVRAYQNRDFDDDSVKQLPNHLISAVQADALLGVVVASTFLLDVILLGQASIYRIVPAKSTNTNADVDNFQHLRRYGINEETAQEFYMEN